MEELLELIKFQGQLILQGPPGTGKTFTAKQLAEKLVLESFKRNYPDMNSILVAFKEVFIRECNKYWKIKGDIDILLIVIAFWEEFKKIVEDTPLKTKQGEKFYVKIKNYNEFDVINGNITVTLAQVNKILDKNFWNLNTSRVSKFDTYAWGIAKAFHNFFLSHKCFTKIKKLFLKIVQFHPSYTYEDFVRGVKLEVDKEIKTPKYEVVNKIFAELCEEAANNPDMNYVLIIDEINRANLPAVLGELIYALEYRDEEVETPYKVGDKGTLKVPRNLYIIGTMNTADRSIGHIDYAIRRRFVFKEILPDKSVIKHPGAKKLYEKVIEKLFQPENVSAEFKSYINDVKIGHTYFLVKDSEKEKLQTSEDEDIETKILAYKFLYQVVPLIKEYIKDGILIGEKVEAVFQEVFNKHLNDLSREDVINYINTSNNKGGTS